METKKLIYKILVIILLTFVANNFNIKSVESPDITLEAIVTTSVILFIAFSVLGLIILFFSGTFDNFLNEKIDPKLKQFYNWLNRRNEN